MFLMVVVHNIEANVIQISLSGYLLTLFSQGMAM